jgi:hypothetical protein
LMPVSLSGVPRATATLNDPAYRPSTVQRESGRGIKYSEWMFTPKDRIFGIPKMCNCFFKLTALFVCVFIAQWSLQNSCIIWHHFLIKFNLCYLNLLRVYYIFFFFSNSFNFFVALRVQYEFSLCMKPSRVPRRIGYQQ